MTAARGWFNWLLWPPSEIPGHDILKHMAQDQQDLDRGLILPLSPEAFEKGQAAIAEKYSELREEATRLVERELRLTENAHKIHANAIQFGLAAAGIVASLGAWLNLYLVWLPLIAFILSIVAAWWFLIQQPPSWLNVMKIWGQDPAEAVDENKRFRKEMYLHLYERVYFSVISDYRQWLHARIALPASLFVVGLALLLMCVSISD